MLPESIVNEVSSPISDGIEPTIDVPATKKPFKCVRSPISVGIVPTILVPESDRRTALLEEEESSHL